MMRLISQDGTYEVPYEGVYLAKKHDEGVNYDWWYAIAVYPTDGTRLNLARYSTEEKLDEALERMRVKYSRLKQNDIITPYFPFPGDD